MILITVNEWIGKARHLSASERAEFKLEERSELVGICTRLPLHAALKSIMRYQSDFNAQSKSAGITFSVVSVAKIEEIDNELIYASGMHLAEAMSVDGE